MGCEAQLAWKCLFRSLFRQAILTYKVGQTDLFFDVRSGFIIRSVHARLQVSVCSGCDLCHTHTHTHTDTQTASWAMNSDVLSEPEFGWDGWSKMLSDNDKRRLNRKQLNTYSMQIQAVLRLGYEMHICCQCQASGPVRAGNKWNCYLLEASEWSDRRTRQTGVSRLQAPSVTATPAAKRELTATACTASLE